MNTLKDAWLFLLNKIIKNENTKTVEDYFELINESVIFSLHDEIYELKDDERIFADYIEMHKVFFTDEDNIFGHSYKSSVLSPVESTDSPTDAIVYLLKKNPTTRKAVLTFAPYGNEKIPCITSVQFLVRDNELTLIFTARGQDIFRKFPCDAMCIAELGHIVAEKMNVRLGKMIANIASAHIYVKDVEPAKAVLEKNRKCIILTGNKDKYSSFKELLSKNGISILEENLALPEIQSADYSEVAKHKAKAAFEHFGYAVWIDDVALVTEAFPNFPGSYTKDIFKILGATDIANFFEGKSKNATMICTLCSFDGHDFSVIQGKSIGKLDFSQKITNPKMPLNSIFVCTETMEHRRTAIENLISHLRKSQC